MKHDPNKSALAAATSVGILYTICSIFVYFFRDQALQLFAPIFHLENITAFAEYFKVTPMGYISGVIQLLVYTYILVFIWIWLYSNVYGGD